MSAVVVDLGGTHLRCGIGDAGGEIWKLEKRRIVSVAEGGETAGTWATIIEAIVGYEKRVREGIGIDAPLVVSFPGPIAKPTRLLNAPTVVGTGAMLDLVGELAERVGRQVYVLNDISAAAWHFSRKLSTRRFMVVTVSSGIGSKIFDREHAIRVLDDVPYAGEIGHVVVDDSTDAERCDCGGRGHLGAISSGRGVERYARKLAVESASEFAQSACVRMFGARGDSLTNEAHIVPAVLLGDAWTLNVVRQCTRPLAKMLLAVTTAFGIERIVVIGGFALALGRIYAEMLRTLLIELCDYEIMASCVQRLIELGDDEEVCLRGAAIYAHEGAGPST